MKGFQMDTKDRADQAAQGPREQTPNDPCECGGQTWAITMSSVQCRPCGRVWHWLGDGWELDPESVPMTETPEERFARARAEAHEQHDNVQEVGRAEVTVPTKRHERDAGWLKRIVDEAHRDVRIKPRHLVSDEAAAKLLSEPQRAPQPSNGPAVLDLLIDTLRARAAAGELKYGTRLQPHNGRDAMVDLLQELADACMYVMQVIAERDAGLQKLHAASGARATEDWQTADEWRAEAHEAIKERDAAIAQLAHLRQQLDEAQEARAQACRERDEARAELVALTRPWVE